MPDLTFGSQIGIALMLVVFIWAAGSMISAKFRQKSNFILAGLIAALKVFVYLYALFSSLFALAVELTLEKITGKKKHPPEAPTDAKNSA